MMDKSAPWTTDADGKDIWFQNDSLKGKMTKEEIMEDTK
jgi:hypothetical protein